MNGKGSLYTGVITYDRQSPRLPLYAWDGADGLTIKSGLRPWNLAKAAFVLDLLEFNFPMDCVSVSC